MDLKQLQTKYAELEKRYGLPSFSAINEDFNIEKIRRGEILLARVIRKTAMDKIVSYIGFIEMLLNPMNAPRMYLVYIKQMTSEDRKLIEELYSKLSDLMLSSFKLDIVYSEKDEAEMIRRICDEWNKLKPSVMQLMENIQKPASSATKEKSYFG